MLGNNKPAIRTVSDRVAEAAGEPPAAASEVVLSRPLATHKGNTNVIRLREATLRDFISYGYIDQPVATDFVDGRATVLKTETDRDALIAWAVALSGLDRTVLGELSAQDAGRLFEAVRKAVEPFSRGN